MNIGRLGQGLGRLGIQGSPSSTLWTPTALGSDIQFWSDANTESSLTLNNQAEGQTVSQWNDISGNNRHLAQTTAGAQPTLIRGMGNILRYTQEFDNAYWSKMAVIVNQNSSIAPDGTITSENIIPTTTASSSHRCSRGITVIANQQYTASVYVRQNGAYNKFGIGSFNGTQNWHQLFLVNLSDDTYTMQVGSPTLIISNVGNGWKRISYNFTPTVSGDSLFIYPAIPNSMTNIFQTFSGDDTTGNLIWGAMVNTGSTPNEYIGRNALATDGVDDRMFTDSFVLPRPFSRFSVVTRRNSSSSVASILNSITGSPIVALYHNLPTSVRVAAGADILVTNSFGEGNTGLFGESLATSAPASQFSFNGGATVTGTAGTNSLDGLNIGSTSVTGFSQNDIHSVLILNRLPTTDERQRIEGYLAHRYGIQAQLPVAHPYKELPPTL